MAEATKRVRVKVNDENGNFFYADPAGENGIVFARGSQELMAKFGGIFTEEGDSPNLNMPMKGLS